jgi:hypothetical protein
MSEIINKTLPIPIKYSKSWHSFSDPNSQIQKFLFELKIISKSNTDEIYSRVFRNLENDKHSNLIIIKDLIKFSEIQKFIISVSKLPFESEFNYELEGTINHNHSAYSQKNDNIYVEFSQNSNGFTICNCSFIGMDFSKICISPPN